LTGQALRNLEYEMLEEAIGFARGAHVYTRLPLRTESVRLIVNEREVRCNHR
jgi:hypothetical protein